MSRHTEREIARRLADTPAAEPPAELLERLRADVPDDLAARLAAADAAADADADSHAGRPAPTPFTRPWLAAAALAVMLLGGGFLAWKLSRAVAPVDTPASEAQVQAGAQAGAERRAAEDRALSATPAAGEAEEGDASAGRADGEAVGGDAPAEAATAPRHPPTPDAGAAAARPPSGDESLRLLPEADAAGSSAASAPSPGTRARRSAPASAADAPAAAGTGSLSVRVTDDSDHSLPGVVVEVEAAGVHRTGISDRKGQVEFERLPAGIYEVTSRLDGFGEFVGKAEVGESEDAEGTIAMSATYAEEVTVSAPAPMIDSTATTGVANSEYLPPPASRRGGRPQPSTVAPPPPPLPDPLPAPSARSTPKAQTAAGAAPPERRQRVETGRLAKRLEEQAEQADADAGVDESEADDVAQSIEAEPVEAEVAMDASVAAPPPAPPANPVVTTTDDRLSTFGLDVDTGSFTYVRAHLEAGEAPPAAAVRVEEMVNAQGYADLFPGEAKAGDETFRVVADGAPSPFAPSPAHRLLRFRVAARDLPAVERRPVVLTLVADVSGSMEGYRLGLVKVGVHRLLDSLRPGDRVALVTFSDQARLAAPHGEPAALARAVDALATEGGTNAEAGLRLGYAQARKAFQPTAVNRVMLLSDGVANVGATGPEEILARVAEEAADGIELTTVGVGMGDFNDALLETLADRGDGRYAYVDDAREVERLFAEELDGTLQTVAEEARVQVEFDPRVVESWRQLGYENRAIADHAFRYDSVDAGEIGPGHSVTALYEVKLRGEPAQVLASGRPLALLKLRWREPAGKDGAPGAFREIERRLTGADLAASWEAADRDLRRAAVAAELAEQLRRSPHADSSRAALAAEARRLAGEGRGGGGRAAAAARAGAAAGDAPGLAFLAERWKELE